MGSFVAPGDEAAPDQTDAGDPVLAQAKQLMENYDYEGALAYLDTIASDYEGKPDYYALCGEALGNMGRYDEAEKVFEKAVLIEPDNASYLDNYGAMMVYGGKYQDGYEIINKAVSLEPWNGEYIGDRGFALYLLGRPGF